MCCGFSLYLIACCRTILHALTHFVAAFFHAIPFTGAALYAPGLSRR